MVTCNEVQCNAIVLGYDRPNNHKPATPINWKERKEGQRNTKRNETVGAGEWKVQVDEPAEATYTHLFLFLDF